jgi:hypothetical protein
MLPMVVGEALGVIGVRLVLLSLHSNGTVNREIRQILYDEIAALTTTLLHLEQLPLLLKNRQKQFRERLGPTGEQVASILAAAQ